MGKGMLLRDLRPDPSPPTAAGERDRHAYLAACWVQEQHQQAARRRQGLFIAAFAASTATTIVLGWLLVTVVPWAALGGRLGTGLRAALPDGSDASITRLAWCCVAGYALAIFVSLEEH